MNASFVGLASEIDVSGLVRAADLSWLSEEAVAVSGDFSKIVLDLSGNRESFLAWIGQGGGAGVQQGILGTLKTARGQGMKWVILNTEKPR